MIALTSFIPLSAPCCAVLPFRYKDLVKAQDAMDKEWNYALLDSYKPALSILFNAFIMAQVRARQARAGQGQGTCRARQGTGRAGSRRAAGLGKARRTEQRRGRGMVAAPALPALVFMTASEQL